jgi:hypothetical protein
MGFSVEKLRGRTASVSGAAIWPRSECHLLHLIPGTRAIATLNCPNLSEIAGRLGREAPKGGALKNCARHSDNYPAGRRFVAKPKWSSR